MPASDPAQTDFELVANTSILWRELDPLDAIRAAAAAGFSAVELWWPFGGPGPDPDEVDAFVQAIASSGLRLVGMNLWAGDLAAGERGTASDPDRVRQFRAALEVACRIADRTRMSVSNGLYGQRRPDRSPHEQDEVATATLAVAADALADAGATLVVEALHRGRNGDYPLETADDVATVLDRVTAAARHGRPGLLFDTFHLAGNGEDLLDVIRRYGDRIRHVQLADAPGRGEPGSGVIDFVGVLDALGPAGYRGAVAAEYEPTVGAPPSFGWMAGLPLRPLR